MQNEFANSSTLDLVDLILSRLLAGINVASEIIPTLIREQSSSPAAPSFIRQRFDLFDAYVLVAIDLLMKQRNPATEQALDAIGGSVKKMRILFLELIKFASLTKEEVSNVCDGVKDMYNSISSILEQLNSSRAIEVSYLKSVAHRSGVYKRSIENIEDLLGP